VNNGLQHVFEKWVERWKKCIARQRGSSSKNRPSPHLHKFPALSNKLSPRTLQTALVKIRLTTGEWPNNTMDSNCSDTEKGLVNSIAGCYSNIDTVKLFFI
jgi:hypothetical protein